MAEDDSQAFRSVVMGWNVAWLDGYVTNQQPAQGTRLTVGWYLTCLAAQRLPSHRLKAVSGLVARLSGGLGGAILR